MELLNHNNLNRLVGELNRRKPHMLDSLNLKQKTLLSVPAVFLAKHVKENS